MRKLKGFSLPEVMIVIAIIVLLSAISIPNLYRARINNNESSAILSMRTISTAAQIYKGDKGRYPLNLTSLGPPAGAQAGSGIVSYCAAIAQPGYLDGKLGCSAAAEGKDCGKDGYNFALTGFTNTFSATARPFRSEGGAIANTGTRSFFVDESGVIRWTTACWDCIPNRSSPELK